MPGIFKTINEGIKGTSMSSFDYLARKDRMALVHYVQSLATFPRKTGSPQAMEALTSQLAAAGEIIPNKIPVSAAMARLSAEYNAPPPLTVRREDQSPGAEILRRVLKDPERAARFLAAIAVMESRLSGACFERSAQYTGKRIFHQLGDSECIRVAGALCRASEAREVSVTEETQWQGHS